jgi:hypothetical protein
MTGPDLLWVRAVAVLGAAFVGFIALARWSAGGSTGWSILPAILEGIARWRDRDGSAAAAGVPDGPGGEQPPSAPVAAEGAAPLTVETVRVRPRVRRLQRFAVGPMPA